MPAPDKWDSLIKMQMVFFFFFFGKCLYSGGVSLYDLLCSDRSAHVCTSCTVRHVITSFHWHRLAAFSSFFLTIYRVELIWCLCTGRPSIPSSLFLLLRLCLGLTTGSVLARSKSPLYLEKEKKVSGEIMDAFAIHGLGSRDAALGLCGRIISWLGAPGPAVSGSRELIFKIKKSLQPTTASMKSPDLTFEGRYDRTDIKWRFGVKGAIPQCAFLRLSSNKCIIQLPRISRGMS